MHAMTRLTALIAGIGCLALAPTIATADVEVGSTDKTFPVTHRERRKPNWSPQQAEKLTGKKSYQTRVLSLANRYLRLEVVPEFGGRLIRAEFRKSEDDKPRQLLWENDVLPNEVSWSMGGMKWSFPHWEHGRKMAETCGYAIVRDKETGRARVAMDMRLNRFLTRPETKRYGLATTQRLVQTVALSPDSTVFEYSGRVDNPMPIRTGMKLWYLIRPAVEVGGEYIYPVSAGCNHGAPKLEDWDPNETIGQRNAVLFGLGRTHDFFGWYYPKADYNLICVADHQKAPGGKQVMYSGGRYIETWGGNNEVFEECGRMLPALSSFEIRTFVLVAAGIGKADFATRHGAVRAARKGTEWEVAFVPTRPIRKATLVASDGRKELRRAFDADPTSPLKTTLSLRGERLQLKIISGSDETLIATTLPVKAAPKPTEKEFQAVQLRVKIRDKKTGRTMPGGAGMFAELTDLTAEHHLSLVKWFDSRMSKYRKTGTWPVSDPNSIAGLLDEYRRFIRLHEPADFAIAWVDKALEMDSDHPHANLYKAMALWEQGKPSAADSYLQAAKVLPGGRYLLALRGMARNDPAAAAKHAAYIVDECKPTDGYYDSGDPSKQYHQTGAELSATRARLLLVLALRDLGKKSQARGELDKLLADDPALIEGWMLAGDQEKLKTLTYRNPAGKQVAEKVLANLKSGKWEGIARPK